MRGVWRRLGRMMERRRNERGSNDGGRSSDSHNNYKSESGDTKMQYCRSTNLMMAGDFVKHMSVPV